MSCVMKMTGFFQFALNLQQFKLHVLAYQRIKGGEGLIHQKHVRVIGKGAGDAYALPHTAGEACAGLRSQPLSPTIEITSMAFSSRCAFGMPLTSSP